MSIRLRLALWYGVLFTLALWTVSFLGYGAFARSQYMTLDRVLILSVHHVAAGVLAVGRSYILDGGPDDSQVSLRLYDADERLRQTSLGSSRLPFSSPRAALRLPAGPAYDRAARLVPVFRPTPRIPPGAAFGLLRVGGERWRRYIIELRRDGQIIGYVEALTPLGNLDRAVADLRRLLLTLGLASLVIVLCLGWAVAGRALAPIARLTRAARGITRSRDLSQRVNVPASRDELGLLAATFNDMLASLEVSARSQQRFISDASHELRAPLTVMQGNLELLRRHPLMTAAEREDVLRDVERETARLARLVADLLLLARRDAGLPLRRAEVDLGAVALEAFRDAHRLAQGQVLRHEVRSGLDLHGDPDRLKQLVLILLDNALKYTPAGQTVELRVGEVGGQLELVVVDEGAGIPAADVPHVFERFYRADPARSDDPGGTGLGLPIAAWIVEQHAGEIELDSRPGEGTRVTVRFEPSTGRGGVSDK